MVPLHQVLKWCKESDAWCEEGASPPLLHQMLVDKWCKEPQQPAPNDHQIQCGSHLDGYKGKFEFHQKLRTSENAKNFCISDDD